MCSQTWIAQCSTDGDSILNLSYSSSLFEDNEDRESVIESDHSAAVKPYQYEPEDSDPFIRRERVSA